MRAGVQGKAAGHQDLEFRPAAADPAEGLIAGFGGVGIEDAVASVDAIADLRFAAIEELIRARAAAVRWVPSPPCRALAAK